LIFYKYRIVSFLEKKSIFRIKFIKMEILQHEQYEYARQRVKQKKNLFFHFVLLFLGSLLLFVLNKILNIYEPINWYLWVVTIWIFAFSLHFIKIFITNSFMNKNWERTQIDKLITKQNKKLEQLQTKVETDFKNQNKE
jgi:2TM domain